PTPAPAPAPAPASASTSTSTSTSKPFPGGSQKADGPLRARRGLAVLPGSEAGAHAHTVEVAVLDHFDLANQAPVAGEADLAAEDADEAAVHVAAVDVAGLGPQLGARRGLATQANRRAAGIDVIGGRTTATGASHAGLGVQAQPGQVGGEVQAVRELLVVADAELRLRLLVLHPGGAQAEAFRDARIAGKQVDLLADQERTAQVAAIGVGDAVDLDLGPAGFDVVVAQAFGGICRKRKGGQQGRRNQGTHWGSISVLSLYHRPVAGRSRPNRDRARILTSSSCFGASTGPVLECARPVR